MENISIHNCKILNDNFDVIKEDGKIKYYVIPYKYEEYFKRYLNKYNNIKSSIYALYSLCSNLEVFVCNTNTNNTIFTRLSSNNNLIYFSLRYLLHILDRCNLSYDLNIKYLNGLITANSLVDKLKCISFIISEIVEHDTNYYSICDETYSICNMITPTNYLYVDIDNYFNYVSENIKKYDFDLNKVLSIRYKDYFSKAICITNNTSILPDDTYVCLTNPIEQYTYRSKPIINERRV